LKGLLLESWEISNEQMTWHVKSGIHWAADNVDWMENRELTAQDMVDDLLYYRNVSVSGSVFKGMSGDIYADGRYTVIIEFSKGFNVAMLRQIGYENRQLYTPPEMIVAGAGMWENQVGTGPFMLKEYVVGSHMTFERNPNYHETTTINGVEYQLPFVDEVIAPIIPDESTRVAALRTGTVDIYQKTPAEQWATIDATAPGISSSKYSGGMGVGINLRCDEPPFDDVNVRRAMFIGTDLKAFADAQGQGPLPIDWFPAFTGDPLVYVPLEDMPADQKILYEYNPTLAKQMLETALGPPDAEGVFFTTQLYTGNTPDCLDRAALLEAQWAKIGVTLEIKAYDTATYYDYIYNKTYTGSCELNPAVANPVTMQIGLSTGDYWNFNLWSNARFDEVLAQMLAEPDEAKRAPMIKELNTIKVTDAILIPTTSIPEGIYWWPWLRNYYGETNVQDIGLQALMAYVWIDEDLKTEMGY